VLVLSRKRSEQICIGDDITITVCEILSEKVRLGITAPRHVAVHRKEVAERIADYPFAPVSPDGRPLIPNLPKDFTRP
jgi:carbon storage regulator